MPGGREVADDHHEPAVRPIYLDEIVEEDMTEVRDFCTIDWALFAEHDRERTSLVIAKKKQLLRFHPPGSALLLPFANAQTQNTHTHIHTAFALSTSPHLPKSPPHPSGSA